MAQEVEAIEARLGRLGRLRDGRACTQGGERQERGEQVAAGRKHAASP
jgi:hypothetical protein